MTVPTTSPYVHIVICIIIGPVIDFMNANVSRALCLPHFALATCFSSSSFSLAHCNAYLRCSPPSATPLVQSSPLRASSAGAWRVGGGGWESSKRYAGRRTSRYEAVQGNKEVEGDASCERVKEHEPGEGEHNDSRRRGSRGGGRWCKKGVHGGEEGRSPSVRHSLERWISSRCLFFFFSVIVLLLQSQGTRCQKPYPNFPR